MAQELELLLKAKNLSAEAFKAVEAHVKSLEKSTKKSETGFTKARRSLNAFGKAAGPSLASVGKALGLVAGAATAGAAAIGVLAKRGAEVTAISQSFDALTASLGESADMMLGEARAATKGLVADLDLMQASNKAMLLGLPVTTESMATMAKAATVLGRAMGQDATKSLDDLTTALGRSSPLILDNLGLTVKVGEANEAYARTLGKTASQLTEAEKKTAFYNAAMDAAQAKVAELGDVTLTFGDRLVQAQAGIQNFTDSLGAAIAQSPALNRALDVIATAMQRAFGQDQSQTIESLMGVVERFAIGLTTFAKVGVEAGRFLTNAWRGLEVLFNTLATMIVDAGAEILTFLADASELAAKIPKIGDAFDGVSESLRGTAQSTRELAGGFAQQAVDALDAAAEEKAAFDAASQFLTKLRRDMELASASGVKMGQETTKALNSISGAAASAGVTLEKLSKETTRAVEDQYKSAMNRVGTIIEAQQREMAADAKEFFFEYGKGFESVEQHTIDWRGELETLAFQFSNLGGTAGEVLGAIASSIAGIATQVGKLTTSFGEGGLAGAAGIGGFFAKMTSGLGILGSAISLATTLGGVLSGIFGGKSEVSKKRDEFFAKFEDGFVGVQRALVGTAGQVEREDWVKQMFDADTVEEFDRVLQKVIATIGEIPTNVQVTTSTSSTGPAPRAPEMARGGIVLPFRPRSAATGAVVHARPGGEMIRAGEGGQAELVAPVEALLGKMQAVALAAAGGGRTEVLSFEVDGEVFGRAVIRRNRAGQLPIRQGSVRRN